MSKKDRERSQQPEPEDGRPTKGELDEDGVRRTRFSDLVNGGEAGLTCRGCGCRHFYVIYTRRTAGRKVVRRRECRNCGRRITTVEQEK